MSPFSYSEKFETYCSYFMSIGMSYEEYWHGDNEAPKQYQKAYEYRRDRQNEMMWVQGMYIYDALIKVAPYFNDFKPREPQKYMSSPIPISKREVERTEKRDKEVAKIQALAKFEELRQKINQSVRNRSQENA